MLRGHSIHFPATLLGLISIQVLENHEIKLKQNVDLFIMFSRDFFPFSNFFVAEHF
jgi:hypothetical protein